ncbi:MAG: Holliday junction branch migration protein RuvA [Myxococcales bacterium]
MIGQLRGKVAAQDDDGGIVVDVGGVGYELFVPLGTVGRVPTDDRGHALFYVHTHVREDALTLFGFATEADRLAFRTLLAVSGVGPKIALAVLGALPSGELARAIAARDLGRLTAITGVGKKTAERLVLELRDKLKTEPTAGPAAARTATVPRRQQEVLVGALTSMGYRAAEAERVASQLEGRMEAPLAELLREALALLAK